MWNGAVDHNQYFILISQPGCLLIKDLEHFNSSNTQWISIISKDLCLNFMKIVRHGSCHQEAWSPMGK